MIATVPARGVAIRAGEKIAFKYIDLCSLGQALEGSISILPTSLEGLCKAGEVSIPALQPNSPRREPMKRVPCYQYPTSAWVMMRESCASGFGGRFLFGLSSVTLTSWVFIPPPTGNRDANTSNT